jgi:hypothetical protein
LVIFWLNFIINLLKIKDMPNKSKYSALFVLPSEDQTALFLKVKD